MSDYICPKCNGTDYQKGEIRTEGGWLSAAFDVSTHRFIAVTCQHCGYTDLYRKDIGTGSKVFDFLMT